MESESEKIFYWVNDFTQRLFEYKSTKYLCSINMYLPTEIKPERGTIHITSGGTSLRDQLVLHCGVEEIDDIIELLTESKSKYAEEMKKWQQFVNKEK